MTAVKVYSKCTRLQHNIMEIIVSQELLFDQEIKNNAEFIKR